MEKRIAFLLCCCLITAVTACSQRNDRGNSAGEGSVVPQLGESAVNGVEYPPQAENGSAESGASEHEDGVAVSMINISKSIEPFDMRENDTNHGWTLTEIESYDTPYEAAFYGFLTFTGEVALTGTITHVNTIYDGFEFIPDEESKERILIPDGNPEKDVFFSIANSDEPSIAESISGLAVNESGEYTVVLTQYRFAYVPMTAINKAIVSSIEEKR